MTLAGFGAIVNSGAAATLIVSNDVDEVFANAISGPVKLVKRGTGDLTLSGVSMFTGGTEIQRGRLIAADTGALGSGEVFVLADCALPFSSKDTSALSALSVACATFTNDIRLSEWTATRPTYQAYGFANYNLQAFCETGTVDFNGTITGGSLSFNNGKERVSPGWRYTSVATVNFKGRIDLSGTVYLLDAATVNFRERVSCALVTSPNFWCHNLNVWPKENAIKAFELGCTALVLNGRDAIPSAIVSGWTGFSDQYHQANDSVDCKGFTQTIDRFASTDEDWSCAAAFPLRWRSSAVGKAPQVVMRATADSRCDWRFENDVSLVWFPTGAFRMTCAADRASSTTGSIVVSNGTFEVIGATTFSNATEIVVADGATFEMNGTAAGAFRSVARVTVGKGATFKLGLVEAYTTADLVLDLASDATVVIPDGAAVDVGAILVEGEGLPLGKAYTGGADVPDAERIPQLRGSGRLSPLAAPPRETVAATWTGAAGTTDLETSANWSVAAVGGLFQSGKIDATFATGGTVAVPTRDVLFNSVAFSGGVTPFALGASGGTTEVGLGTGGLAASAATAETTVFAPVGIYGSQTWDVGADHVLSLTGGVRQAVAKPTTVTKTGTGTLKLYGCGDAGTFAGNFAVGGALEAHGDDPFGRAVAGVDGAVQIVGANKDYAVKFGDCRITKPVRVTGTFADGSSGAGYFGVKDKCTAEFAGPVDIGAGVNFRLEQFKAKVVFSGGGTFAGRFQSYSGDITITNKPMTITFKDTPCGTSTIRFGVSGNVVDAITPTQYAQSVEFHADDAFAGNETELLAWFHWGNNTYYGSTIDLNGHSQHVGTFRSRVVPPTAATKSPFAYTPTANSRITSATPATLFVNQLADGVTIVPFMGQASLSKSGPATLVSSNTTHTATAALAVTGGSLELFDAAWPNATGVTVDATAGLDATLRLTVGPDARATIFPKRIPIALVDGAETVAKIEIPAGVQLRAKNLTVNGRVRSGVWGSSESGAPNVDDVHFAGKGTVFGYGGGLMLILK